MHKEIIIIRNYVMEELFKIEQGWNRNPGTDPMSWFVDFLNIATDNPVFLMIVKVCVSEKFNKKEASSFWLGNSIVNHYLQLLDQRIQSSLAMYDIKEDVIKLAEGITLGKEHRLIGDEKTFLQIDVSLRYFLAQILDRLDKLFSSNELKIYIGNMVIENPGGHWSTSFILSTTENLLRLPEHRALELPKECIIDYYCVPNKIHPIQMDGLQTHVAGTQRVMNGEFKYSVHVPNSKYYITIKELPAFEKSFDLSQGIDR